MYGPEPIGHWSKYKRPDIDSSHGILKAGKKYVVVKEFPDFEKDLHPVGETWTFIGCSFSPYDDGLSLFVSFDDLQEWQIRMQWRPEEQGPIIDNFESYMREA